MNRRGWRRLTVNRRLFITLKSGETFAGVVLEERSGLLRIGDVTLYEDGRSPTELDGEAIIDLDNVAFAQIAAPRSAPTTSTPRAEE